MEIEKKTDCLEAVKITGNKEKKHCDVCNVDISKSNWYIHITTIKHETNEKLKNGINPDIDKLRKIIAMLANENMKLKFELNSYKN